MSRLSRLASRLRRESPPSPPLEEVPGPCAPYFESWPAGEAPDGVPRLYARVTDPGASRVLNHMCVHGHVTLDGVRETYGYEDPMVPLRLIMAATVPLERSTVTDRDGVGVDVWRLSDPSLAVLGMDRAT